MQEYPMPNAAFAMPRFYFHIRNGSRSFDDLIGEYQADQASAFDRALQIAKELRSRAEYSGFAIVVVNDDGQEVARMPVAFNRQEAAA
jgi:hypothetical protein